MAEVFSNKAVAMTFDSVPVTERVNKSTNKKNDSKQNVKKTDSRPRMSAEEALENKRQIIKNVITRDGAKYVSFSGDLEAGMLVCGVESDKDGLFFVWYDKDRKLNLTSQKESYKLLREVPGNMSVLDYLYENQRDFLRETVDNWLEDNKDEFKLITDIAIRVQRGGGNNRGKFNGKKNKKSAKK